jgi:hypothetical protein
MALGANRHRPWLDTENLDLDSISVFSLGMTSNEKSLNYKVADRLFGDIRYKVADLVESYKFRINLSPSEFIQKNYDFLKID